MIQNACMRGLRKVSNKKNRRSVRSACFEMDAAVPCGTSQRRELLQFFQRSFVFGDDGHFRFAQVPNAGLGHVQINLPATLGLRICLAEKLSQILQGCFVLGDNFSLCSELGAFGVHDCFWSSIDELLVRQLAFDRSGE